MLLHLWTFFSCLMRRSLLDGGKRHLWINFRTWNPLNFSNLKIYFYDMIDDNKGKIRMDLIIEQMKNKGKGLNILHQ